MDSTNNSHNINDGAQTCSICGEDHRYTQCPSIQIIHHVPDNIVPTKARLTLPNSLRIEKMSEGSLSVISKHLIAKGTQFGPYQAKPVFTLDPQIAFPLKIFSPNDYFSEFYLDTNTEDDCNWMMFVSPAHNFEEQNLISFQDGDKIYYVSIRDINAGEFLKVWYSPFYAKKMNKNILTAQASFKENHQLDLNSLLKKQQNLMERDTWTCKFCSLQENDVIKFARHITEHYSMQIKKVCTVCKSTFSTYKSLKKHLKIVHSDIKSKKVAVETDSVSKNKNEKNHMKDSLLGGPLLNDVLTDSVDNSNLFLQQAFDISNIEHQNLLLENDNLNLNVEHLLNENDSFNFDIGEDKEQYVCDICLKQFSKLQLLVQHLRKHTGKYTCTECFRIFCRNENLKAHKCNFNRPQYKCNICQKLFSQKKYVVRHMVSVHEKKHQCPKCAKNFSGDKAFREHNCPCVPESEKEKYPCPECTKIFYHESYLRRHMQRHTPKTSKKTNESKLICEICAKTFLSIRYLHSHKKSHFEKSVSCKMCDKKFSRADTLNIHMESCHSSDTHLCQLCNKQFKTKRYLQLHMPTHSATRKYKCSDCDLRFLLKANMMKHYNTKHKKACNICKVDECVHDVKPSNLESYYECGLCKKAVKLRSSMTRHIKRAHPNAVIDFKKITRGEKEKMAILRDEAAEDIADAIFVEQNNKNKFDANNKNASDDQLESYFFYKDKNDSCTQTFDNLTRNFESIVNPCNTIHFSQSSYGNDDVGISITSTDKNNATILDFNSLDLDLDSGPNVQQELQINNQEVCLSMPELNDVDQEITLGENAFILDNGTIVEPLEQGNVLVYILEKKFVGINQND